VLGWGLAGGVALAGVVLLSPPGPAGSFAGFSPSMPSN
jgi:hypothetical protein